MAYTSTVDDANLWHKRLEHANYESISQMYEAGLVKETISVEKQIGICEVCQLGKQASRIECVRKNMTIMDMARCLLFESKLPKEFWAEAVNTSVYLLNRCCRRKDSIRSLNWDVTKAEQRLGELGSQNHYDDCKLRLQSSDELIKADFDNTPIRGTRSIDEIYQRADVALLEPASFEEAEIIEGWKETMQKEMSMIHKNQTWELIDKPSHKKVIGVKWVLKTKLNVDGSLNKLKARLEEIYMEQPAGFTIKGQEEKVYRLKKALYDLKRVCKLVQEGIFISQQGFTLNILKRFCMAKCKPISTPIALGEKLCSSENFQKVYEKNYRSFVDCLLYLTTTRLDIMFVVGLLPRFMHCCDTSHFKAMKRVLRYVKGTTDFSVWFATANTIMANSLKLIGYTDSNLAGSVDDMQSTFEYFFSFGSGVFSWSLKKQSIVAQSITETEYVAAAAVN
ncbi:disease resistance protein TAO1-like [Gossypium australe]|uniref:Disease resistance protein TAO1-like n=1 Tax=Gossypium australe TaxID=47621 RepID=A0A5B6X454_9ROSI|nr:disease resistance protein TAO1-like [Gossypium australe]